MRGITTTKAPEPTAAASAKPKSLFGGGDDGSDSDIPEPIVTKSKSIFGGGGGSASDADEDDDLPVAPRRKRRSPTPRISPTSPQAAREYRDSSDEDDAPAAILKTDRFKALVAKAQRERLEKEAAEKEKLARRREAEDDMVVSSEDGETTKKGKVRKEKGERPTRKTAKKAILDIQKETQRIQRNQQLAHEARSRTKVTKNDLFAKFGFKPEGMEEEVQVEKEVRVEEVVMEDVPEVQEEKGGSASDVEEIFNKLVDAATKGPTPKKKPVSPAAAKAVPPSPKIDKGKGRALPSPPPPDPKPERPLRIHLPAKALQLDSDDSDLEIIDPAREKEKANARAGAEKQKLIQSLIRERKYTANIRLSPNKKKVPTAKQLHAKLQAASRKQAVDEREERMQELRAQGIHIPTAEEREKEMAEVENLVEKARLEALRIKKLERRREKAKKGEKLDDDDDEDDGDWFDGEVPEDEGLTQLSAEDSDEAAFLDGEAEESGSSDNDEEKDGDEEKEDVEMEGADESVSPTFSLSSIKDQQRDSVSPTPRLSDMPAVLEDSDSDDGAFAPLKRKQRRAARVIDDEEEDEAPPTVQKKPEPSSVPDIFKNFAGPSMGMTQLFAGSAVSTADVVGTMGAKVDALRLRHAPEDSIPNSQAPDEDESQDIVPDTQLGNKLDLSYTQDVEYQVLATQEEEPLSTQDMPEPTQDNGFTFSSSPVPPRFTSTSPARTVPTQLLDDDELSPSKPKRGRLSRTRQNFSDSEQSAADSSADADSAPSPVKKAPKPKRAPAPAYDKKTSEAKGLFHEQASESEDEYAGIGGASGDEGSDASDAEVRAMLNDTHDETLDERELAAFYAKRAVADDERDVSKIFRDLQSGLLRKKRGAGAADLDDSDDEYSEILRKQRAKKRQMAAIRRLLTQDQTLEKIAKDPKKAAFFKSLEGDASDVDDDFLDREAENPFETQETATPVENAGDTQPTSAEPSQQQQARRPVKSSKPGLADIRETLSFLVEDKTLLSASDSEPEPEPAPANPRRTTTIIDRTTLSRSSSNSHQSKLAFKPDGADAASGFRVPTLLRRATTGLSSASGASGSAGSREGSVVTERSLGEQGLKKGGGNVRAVGGFKKKKVEKGEEMERKRKREREVEAVRRRGMGVGGLGGGSGVFE